MSSFLITNVSKADASDKDRILTLLNKYEGEFARNFMLLIKAIKDESSISEIAILIEAGRMQEALEKIESALIKFSDTVIMAVVASGQSAAAFIESALGVIVSFDQTNYFAVTKMRESKLRLITQITNAQRDAIRQVLIDGIENGINPVSQARNLINSIGLTSRQVQAINNFRRALENGDSAALNRALRDRRFDSTIRRAIAGETLTQNQIDKMVQRYSERQLSFRAKVIARTEALRAVHQGSSLMFNQAIESGVLIANQLQQEWNTSKDKRVRDTHDGMEGQVRNYGEKFISDAGNELEYPGDDSAPGAETILCRCIVTTTFKADDENSLI